MGIPNESPEAAVGISFKKTALAGEQERPGIARKRARRKARPGSIDLKRLGFIDETRARTDMAPLRGRAARGRRPTGRAPFGHRNTMTFIAALRQDGIVAPRVIAGSVNGEAFRTCVAQVPVPALRPPCARPAPALRPPCARPAPALRPDDIVIPDNPASHDTKRLEARLT